MTLNRLFQILFVYYWFAYNALSFETTPGGITYIMLIVPISIFIGVGVVELFSGTRFVLSASIISLATYILFAVLIALMRLDNIAILNITISIVPLFIVIGCRLHLSLRLINVLFILQVIIGVSFYHLGLTESKYFVTGFSSDLKVNIFPFHSETISGIFCLIVFSSNFFLSEKKWTKWLILLFSMYFTIFSGMRTLSIIIGAIVAFIIIKRYVQFKNRLLYKSLPIFFIGGLLVVLINLNLFSLFSSNDGFLKAYTLRGITREDYDPLRDLSRLVIWNSHKELFFDNPLIGVGSFKMYDYYDINYGDTESPLTYNMARDGVVAILIFVFFYYLWRDATITLDAYKYIMIVSFFLLLILYGSVMHGTNVVYLMIIGAINIGNRDKLVSGA
jgi:hypothetical protein